MVAAKKVVDAYKTGIEDYLICEKMISRREKAEEELLKVADRFNAQVKAYKAKG